MNLAATVIESRSKARALRTQPCQRAAKGLSSIAWTRHLTLARGLKATNRLLHPAPATKQEPPTEGTAPDLDTPRPRGWCGHPSGSLAVGRNLGTLRLLLGAAYLCSGAVVIGCLGPMVGTVVVAVNPPGPSAQMAIAEAAGPCPEDTAFCRERNPPMPTRGDNRLTF